MEELAVMLAERTGLSRLRGMINMIESANRQPVEKATWGVEGHAQAAVIIMGNETAFRDSNLPGEDAAPGAAASRGAIDPGHSVLMCAVRRLGDIPELREAPIRNDIDVKLAAHDRLKLDFRPFDEASEAETADCRSEKAVAVLRGRCDRLPIVAEQAEDNTWRPNVPAR